MDVEYSESVKHWDEGLPLVREATRRLEEIVGKSGNIVSSVWDRPESSGNSIAITLRYKDADVEATATYALEEFRSPNSRSFRLQRLWGELLQTRGERDLATLMARHGD